MYPFPPLPTLDNTGYVGLLSMDVAPAQSIDGRDHQIGAETPISFSPSTSGAPASQAPTQSTIPEDPTAAALQQVAGLFTGGYSGKAIGITVVVVIVAVGLILLSAYRIIK